ncbi:MAG: hypothetical protein QM805_11265, partial [Pseudomonas sp.]
MALGDQILSMVRDSTRPAQRTGATRSNQAQLQGREDTKASKPENLANRQGAVGSIVFPYNLSNT